MCVPLVILSPIFRSMSHLKWYFTMWERGQHLFFFSHGYSIDPAPPIEKAIVPHRTATLSFSLIKELYNVCPFLDSLLCLYVEFFYHTRLLCNFFIYSKSMCLPCLSTTVSELYLIFCGINYLWYILIPSIICSQLCFHLFNYVPIPSSHLRLLMSRRNYSCAMLGILWFYKYLDLEDSLVRTRERKGEDQFSRVMVSVYYLILELKIKR